MTCAFNYQPVFWKDRVNCRSNDVHYDIIDAYDNTAIGYYNFDSPQGMAVLNDDAHMLFLDSSFYQLVYRRKLSNEFSLSTKYTHDYAGVAGISQVFGDVVTIGSDIYIVEFTNYTAPSATIKVMKSTDNGDNFTEITSFSYAYYYSFASVNVVGSEIWIVASTTTETRIHKVTTSGVVTTQAVFTLPAGQGGVNIGEIITSDDGDLILIASCQATTKTDPSKLYSLHSSDSGATWAETLRVSSNIGNIPMKPLGGAFSTIADGIILTSNDTTAFSSYNHIEVAVITVTSGVWTLSETNIKHYGTALTPGIYTVYSPLTAFIYACDGDLYLIDFVAYPDATVVQLKLTGTTFNTLSIFPILYDSIICTKNNNVVYVSYYIDRDQVGLSGSHLDRILFNSTGNTLSQ